MYNNELDFIPLKMDLTIYNCIEQGILSVLQFYNMDIHKYFWDSLNLIYDIDAIISSNEHGFRFVYRTKDETEPCLDAYGIKFISWKQNCNKMSIINSLQKNIPVLAYVDVYWDKNNASHYKKIHSSGHSRIITGFNENSDLLAYYEWNNK